MPPLFPPAPSHVHTKTHIGTHVGTHIGVNADKRHMVSSHTHTHTHTHTHVVAFRRTLLSEFQANTFRSECFVIAPSRERKETIRHQQDNTTSRHHHNTTTRQHTKKETNRHRILSPSPWAANKLAAFALLRPPPRHRHRGQGLTQVWTRTHARMDRDTRKYMDRPTRKYGAHASTEHCSLEYLL